MQIYLSEVGIQHLNISKSMNSGYGFVYEWGNYPCHLDFCLIGLWRTTMGTLSKDHWQSDIIFEK